MNRMNRIERARPYEMAARIYCSKLGVPDADQMMPQPHPDGLAVLVPIPLWCLVAEEMIDLSMRLTSMREAKEAEAKAAS